MAHQGAEERAESGVVARQGAYTLKGMLWHARAQKDELDRAWWHEAAEQGEGPAGGGHAEAPADEAGLDTWQARRAHTSKPPRKSHSLMKPKP